MAKATRTPGTPAHSEEEVAAVRAFSDFKEGDTINYVSYYSNAVDVRRTVEVPAVPGKVVLELDFDEATVLRDLVRTIRGDSRESRRRFTDAIDVALADAGVEFTNEGNYEVGDLRGGLEFLTPDGDELLTD